MPLLVFRFMAERFWVGARGHAREQSRLLIPTGCRPFGRRRAVVFQFEQGKLPGLGGLSCLKLLPPQFAKALPAKGVAINDENVRLCHDTLPLRPRRPERRFWSASRSGNPPRVARAKRR